VFANKRGSAFGFRIFLASAPRLVLGYPHPCSNIISVTQFLILLGGRDAHLARWNAAIFLRAAADMVCFTGADVFAIVAGCDAFLALAHLAFCALAIFRRDAADITRVSVDGDAVTKPPERISKVSTAKRARLSDSHPCLNRFGLSFWYCERRARNNAPSHPLPYQRLDIARRAPDAVRAWA